MNKIDEVFDKIYDLKVINNEKINDGLNRLHSYCEYFGINYDKLMSHKTKIIPHYETFDICFDNCEYKVGIQFKDWYEKCPCKCYVLIIDDKFDDSVKHVNYVLNSIVGDHDAKYYTNTQMLNCDYTNIHIENLVYSWLYTDLKQNKIKKNTKIVSDIDNIITQKIIEIGLDISKTKNKWYINGKLGSECIEVFLNTTWDRLYLFINKKLNKVVGYGFTQKELVDEESFKKRYNELDWK